jgi:chromosome segregation ATPase
VKNTRAKLLDEAEETESQIKQWEQKVQIEKETQTELHTSKDAIDTKGMQKEIQKMKHRLESLVRIQEQLLRDMELAIHKREDIAVKYKNTKCGGRNAQQPTLTKGELAKKVDMARLKLKKLDDSMREATDAVAKTREDLSAVRLLLNDVETKYESTSSLSNSLQNEVDAKNFERTRLQSMCELQEELLKRYEALHQGQLPPIQASKREEFAIERELIVSKKTLDKVANIITGLALKFERYEDVFDRMNLCLSSVLNEI